ncbi:MAG: nucleotidyl transferase AbiEii/AbiGii toxin family protein [Gammaproteobacteria bacterium]|nr:nucleotidyl transferase AbiEii/AbiGii toxin family protein [Gammaproteobacteria bacterium]
MIEKNEVLRLATALSLRPDTVEKDYVLGWFLYGIYHHGKISSWVFKGGTSLKKCFFETYRFSEDLDFTVTDPSQLTQEFLQSAFDEITKFLYDDEVGIEFFPDRFNFKIIPKDNGQVSAQAKIHYNGPLRRTQGVASIKLDLTTDEILVLSPVRKSVHHPYTDKPDDGIHVNCYAFEEVVAEKIRALSERARPRDLYDVVHFFRNRNLIQEPKLVYKVLQKKCDYKAIEVPTFQHIEAHEKIDELETQWENMLAHQLAHLPPMQAFWDDLPLFFEWLTNQLNVSPAISNYARVGETLFQPGRVTSAFTVNKILHNIQFASANRLCVYVQYNNKNRTIEPLSFRTSSAGNRLFYGYEREAGHVKAYTLSKIQSVDITEQPYTERYPVEISSTGIISMPPIRRALQTSQHSRSIGELKYRYQCSHCGKIFSRIKQNNKLRPHKTKTGWSCTGRYGVYLGYR